MHQDAVPTWGRGPTIGRQGKTVGSLISLASRRRSLSGSALVSVDLSVCGTGLHCWTKGKCASGEEVQRYTFKRPKPLQIRKYIFGSVFWGLHEPFFALWSLASLYFFASEKLILIESLLAIERARERCSPPFASTRNRIFLSDFEAVINISEVTGTVEVIRQFGRTKTGTVG